VVSSYQLWSSADIVAHLGNFGIFFGLDVKAENWVCREKLKRYGTARLCEVWTSDIVEF
jgi:hypothetical protein